MTDKSEALSGLKMFDVFGLEMKWRVNGKKKFKTYVGVFFTFWFCLISLFFGIREFLSMYLMSSPDITQY